MKDIEDSRGGGRIAGQEITGKRIEMEKVVCCRW